MVWIKIWVMAVVAITGPPAGVDGELRKVSEPVSDQVRINSRRGAAHQSAKRVEVCRSRSLGDQVRVEELVMSNLIIGVVVDVVLHFILNNLQGVRVGFIATAARNFVVLNAAEFVVLDPKVGFECFQRRREPKQCRVSGRKANTCLSGSDAAQQSRANGSCSQGDRFGQEGTTADEPFPVFTFLLQVIL